MKFLTFLGVILMFVGLGALIVGLVYVFIGEVSKNKQTQKKGGKILMWASISLAVSVTLCSTFN